MEKLESLAQEKLRTQHHSKMNRSNKKGEIGDFQEIFFQEQTIIKKSKNISVLLPKKVNNNYSKAFQEEIDLKTSIVKGTWL